MTSGFHWLSKTYLSLSSLYVIQIISKVRSLNSPIIPNLYLPLQKVVSFPTGTIIIVTVHFRQTANYSKLQPVHHLAVLTHTCDWQASHADIVILRTLRPYLQTSYFFYVIITLFGKFLVSLLLY